MNYVAFGIVLLIVCFVLAFLVVFTILKSLKNAKKFISKRNFAFFLSSLLIVYLIFLTAGIYTKTKIEPLYCLSLVSDTLELLKFKFKYANVQPLCEAYPIFYVDFFFAFIIYEITAVLSVASLFSIKIYNFIMVRRAFRKNSDIVIGYSDNAVEYMKNTKNTVLLGIGISEQTYTDLIKQGIHVTKMTLDSKRLIKKFKKGEFNVIVFRNKEISFTKIIDSFAKMHLENYVSVYFEANGKEMRIIKDKFISKGDHIPKMYLTSFNKYELISRQFIKDYPISKYIPRDFYNENYSLKENKKINVVFVGFGQVNYSLFRMMAIQFQFVRENGKKDLKPFESKLESSPLNYYIFDKEKSALNNECISRIKSFNTAFEDCDFPKPEKICELKEVRDCDVNSSEFKKELKKLVSKDSFTYFIVSLENDLEDASYAKDLEDILRDETNYRIFVRAKNELNEELNEEGDRVIYFGNERIFYSHENIVNDDLIYLARKNNEEYNKKNLSKKKNNGDNTDISDNKVVGSSEENQKISARKQILEMWDNLDQTMQISNLYLALSLPFKLGILGFDMLKSVDGNVETNESKFNERYVNSGNSNNYKDISFYFKDESSNVLAYSEHSRWNALYYLSGYNQLKKEGFEKKGDSVTHKDSKNKKHACLTSYDGIKSVIDYKYKMLISENNLERDITDADYKNENYISLYNLYSYDYMSLDKLCNVIKESGYTLVDFLD